MGLEKDGVGRFESGIEEAEYLSENPIELDGTHSRKSGKEKKCGRFFLGKTKLQTDVWRDWPFIR